MLAELLERGYRYAFVSNADNLGAVARAAHRWPGSPRRAAVRDGGRRRAPRPTARAATSRGAATGGCVLRETAQAPEEDRGVPGHRPLALLQHEQPLDRPAGARRVLDARRRARPAADRQPQDRRPGRPGIARGHPARDRDGRRDRRVRRRARAMRVAADPLRAGQDDQRPARAALRRLRADGRRRASSSRAATTTPFVDLDPRTSAARATSRRASRPARRRSPRASGSSCAAT